MTNHPLAAAFAKLSRSDTHIASLFYEFSRYLKSAPYQIIAESNIREGHPRLVFHVTEQPSLDVATIVGDVLYNLRSTLDCLVYALITRNGFTPKVQTQFPICTTEVEFWNESVAHNRLCGISLEAFRIVDAFQPYHMGLKYQLHPLWHLYKLSNLDKLRELTLSAICRQCEWTLSTPEGQQFGAEATPDIVYDGTIVGSLPLRVSPRNVKIQGKVSCQVSFQEAPVKDHEVVDVLQSIRAFIGNLILPAVTPFFEPLPRELRLTAQDVTRKLAEKPSLDLTGHIDGAVQTVLG